MQHINITSNLSDSYAMKLCQYICESVHTNVFAKSRKLHKFAITNSNFEKKSITSDMYHRKTYVLQHNRVSR